MQDRARAIALLAILGLALPVALAPQRACAHTRSMSYATWTLDESGARVELRLKLIELTRAPPDHAWTERLPAELTLESGGDPCRASEATRVRPSPDDWAVFRWRVHCDTGGERILRSSLLRDVATSHTSFVRVQSAAGDPSTALREYVLVTDRDRGVAIDPVMRDGRSSASTTFPRFVALGAEHIASGWDHLAFVLALLLLAGTLREVAVLVTSFTAAHSLTLGLAVTGVVRPEAMGVEVAIAFSIALVAAENAWLLAGRDRIVPAVCVALLLATAVASLDGVGALRPLFWLGLALFSGCHFGLLRRSSRPERLRTALAFAFGLLHGFGFAGALMDLELPTSNLAVALFGFNVGVELGQLALVVIVWPVLAALAKRTPASARIVAEVGSAAILAFGLFFTVERAF